MLDRQAAVGALSREGLVFRLLSEPGGNSVLYPIHHPRIISPEHLVGMKKAHEQLVQNLLGIRTGLSPLPTLIEGFRGTGKTSLALAAWQKLNTPPFPAHSAPCHLVQIAREGIHDIVPLIDVLSETTAPSIILIDDLYFRDGDPLLHTFRGILDGGIMEFPPHVALIVTSNHRHLIEERHSFREDALRSSEIIDETMALSDRFGLTISTWEPDMKTYIRIVLSKLLEEGAIETIPSGWESEFSIFETTEWEVSRSAAKTPLSGTFLMAKKFSLERGSRSGRTASLFAKMVRRGLIEDWHSPALR